MKYFRVIKSPYSYKFENKDFEAKISFSYDRINKIKNFIVSNNFIAESKIVDYTDDPNLEQDIYYLEDNTNNIFYISNFIDPNIYKSEFLNIKKDFDHVNIYEIIRQEIKPIKPLKYLEDNKFYVPIELKYPISNIVNTFNTLPKTYIKIINEFIIYDPSIVRFYDTDTEKTDVKYIYPPITIFPHIKENIIKNLIYNKVYNKYFFEIHLFFIVEPNIGYTILKTNKIFYYKYILNFYSSIKEKIEKSNILEIILYSKIS